MVIGVAINIMASSMDIDILYECSTADIAKPAIPGNSATQNGVIWLESGLLIHGIHERDAD